MAKKSLYFDSYCGYTLSAIAENGKVCEFKFEKNTDTCNVGDVYKGRIESILPGMQAIFVNCGLQRNCFLSTDDALPDSENYDVGAAPDVFSTLKEGDEILVQVTKLPVGKKGAKVTARPSFIGKCIIYMPNTPFVGVSRKIADDELRRNLMFLAKRLKCEDEGIVVRTAGPYAKRNEVKYEYTYLKNLYNEVIEKFKSAQVGELLYTDSALPVKVLRDILFTDIEEIIVGNKKLKEQVESIVNLYPTHTKRSVRLHDTGRDMLEETGISAQIMTIASPRVELENGAYIIIEKTEALTVIDVNTGKFTGDYNREQTVYHTNIMAAREIARQARLRNIGGIIVVDFIDMTSTAHNKALVDELERALKDDNAKCDVSPMSKFGLVEFTRKRMGASPLSLITKPCKYCNEAGYTITAEYILFGLRAKVLNFIAEGAKALRVDMNRDILLYMLDWRAFTDNLKSLGLPIYAVPHRTYHEQLINYRADEFDIPDDAVKLS